ncbi:hypothetical protein SAMN04490240_4083 [Rhodococcus pyridinivorans]|uniref:hypothetical protein n=1 Tax=Rhodococcus pyridinivorans TaxID=103816 RepID=UPI0007CD6085|nr:hypothetical protein [Rhodococcus pyridinivorans]SED51513.1 hypothetical protein SAMN04490240_4083 [Rhodococcus pyridinivorans]
MNAIEQGARARVWDHDFNLIGEVQPSAIQDEEGVITLDRNDPIAKALTSKTAAPKWLTVDSRSGRWTGRLRFTERTTRNPNVTFTFEPLPPDEYGRQWSQCAQCGDVIYDGIWIPESDLNDLVRIHNTHCGTTT